MQIPWRALVLAITINLLWGANVPAVKMALIAVPPLWTAFSRFTLGVTCLVLWARWHGISLRPTREELPWLLLLGGLFTVQIGSMNWGIQLTTSSIAAILIATNPLFAAFFAHLFVPGDRLQPKRMAGMALAFAGILSIFLPWGGDWGNMGVALGNGVVLASACLLGGRLVFAARLLQRMEATRVTVWQMLVTLPVFALVATLTEQVDWDALGWLPVAGIAYQGIVVAGFNFMALAWLLRRYPASIVLGFNFVSPPFGVLLSALILGESVGWPVLAGLCAVGLGLLLIARK